MKIALAWGEVDLYVHHDEADIPIKQNSSEWHRVRRTIIIVQLPDGREFTGQAVCKPPDQFNRKTGRILATRRLAAVLRHELTREDRQQIFKAIWRKRR